MRYSRVHPTTVSGWHVDREALAWAAGFFDGEGTIAAYHHRGADRAAKPVIRIAQVDRRPLDRFRLAVGRGSVIGPIIPKGHKTWSEHHAYKLTNFEEVQAVIVMLWPFLSEPKREAAVKALQIMRSWFEMLHSLCRRKRHVLSEVGLTSVGSCAACAAIGRRNNGTRPLTASERAVLEIIGEPIEVRKLPAA